MVLVDNGSSVTLRAMQIYESKIQRMTISLVEFSVESKNTLE